MGTQVARKFFGQDDAPEVEGVRGILGSYTDFINTPSEGLWRWAAMFDARCKRTRPSVAVPLRCVFRRLS